LPSHSYQTAFFSPQAEQSAIFVTEVVLDFEIQRNTWYRVEIALLDGVIYGSVNGKVYLTYTPGENELLIMGSAGIRSSQGTALFDNFAIKVPVDAPVYEDSCDKLDGWKDATANGQWSVGRRFQPGQC